MGRPLFAGGAQLDVLLRIRDVDLRPLEQSDKRIPSDVRRVLREGLRVDPKERPDAKQLAAALESICARRGFPADASAQVARLMASYELCPPVHQDEAGEAGARF